MTKTNSKKYFYTESKTREIVNQVTNAVISVATPAEGDGSGGQRPILVSLFKVDPNVASGLAAGDILYVFEEAAELVARTASGRYVGVIDPARQSAVRKRDYATVQVFGVSTEPLSVVVEVS